MNAHLIRELTRTHETTEQIWTEMMLGVLKWDWRIPFDPAQEPAERTSGFSFFGTFTFFSLHKEKKKSNKEIWNKRKILFKKIIATR